MTKQTDPQQSVIYSYTSNQHPVADCALAIRLKRCQDFADHNNYDVVNYFCDSGLSDTPLARPEIQAMLAYLKDHKDQQIIVIVNDIRCLARNINDFVQLRDAIYETGAILQSPSMPFDDTPESRCTNNMLMLMAGFLQEWEDEQISESESNFYH